MTPDPADKSLLRCTLKKSVDVFAKLVLYASYAVCGVTALVLAILGVIAISDALFVPAMAVLITAAYWGGFVFGSLAGVLAAIPWYVYVGITAVAMIFGYSLLWCINRELKEEDKADPFGDDFGLTFALSIMWLVIGMLVSYSFVTILGRDQTIFVFGAFLYFLGIPTSYVVLTFQHYRKRMKEERK